ncbi:MAG TPA: alpha/beta hydrolase [Candidatus Angelobacter sp.]
MPSLRGRLATILVRIIVKHWPANDSAALVRRARRVFGEPKFVRFRPPRGLKIEEVVTDVRGEWLIPSDLRFPDSVLLYFHGGGYVSCSAKGHRPITTTLARSIGCRVFSLDYRLAPEYPFPAAADDAFNAFHWLVRNSINPKKIALAGDSAGGGLVFATLVRLRDEGISPACAVGISPWVDMTGEYSITNQKSCAMFFPADGMAFAQIYLNGASPKSPLASPLLADLNGLPPLLIQAADKELLFDDAVRLHEKATTSGVESKLHIYPGLPHVWQMFTGVLPEADQALKEIAEFISQKFTVASTAFPA